MAKQSLQAKVEQIRNFIDSLGEPLAFRKLNGILNALEIQVEDGDYQRHVVTRLCEAILASADSHHLLNNHAERFESIVCAVVTFVEDRR